MSSTHRVPRRSFLGLASLAAAACAAPRAARPAPVVSAAPAPIGEARWAELRREFLLTPDRVHLAGLLMASNPRVVRESVEWFRKALDEDPVRILHEDFETGKHTNATLDAASKYIGAPRDEIALTDSTTSGIALVYGGLPLERGDEIVTTKHDHFVTHETLRLAAERSGATIKTVTLYDDASRANEKAMVQAIASAISPATRVIAVTWVHSSTGVKIPVRGMADAIAKINATRGPREQITFCVDGVHGFGVENVTMQDLGCDFFMAGCHKWIFGPRGTGIVWGRATAWKRLRLVACPFHFQYVMAREYGGNVPPIDGRIATPGGFRAFEHRWGLASAFDFHMFVGKKDVEARIHDLARQCKKGLASMRHVKLHTPTDDAVSSGIVCFEVAGMNEDQVVARLLSEGIVASTTPYRPSYARLTPGITNTPEEIERTLAAIRKLA